MSILPSTRRVRIQGNPTMPTGYAVTVRDADTGEIIYGVACAVIYLNPAKVNEVELVCYETDEEGRILTSDGEVRMKKARFEDPEVEITAYER